MFDTEHSGVANGDLPLVTVAMPIYNAGKYLRLAVLSIVKQSFTNWELLIIDDGSTDGALQSIADIKDARIEILCDGKNKGLAVRLNECIDLARGKYFARMDQDDVSFPERFMQQVSTLEADLTLDLTAVRAITIDEDNIAIDLLPCAQKHDDICAKPWRGFYIPHPTWVGRTEWFRKYRYTVPGPYFCEDQELLLRSYRHSRFSVLSEVLFAYRIRSTINQEKLAKTRKAVLGIQLKYFGKSGQWHYWLLALLAYAGKKANDLLKRAGIKSGMAGHEVASTSLRHDWKAMLGELLLEQERKRDA